MFYGKPSKVFDDLRSGSLEIETVTLNIVYMPKYMIWFCMCVHLCLLVCVCCVFSFTRSFLHRDDMDIMIVLNCDIAAVR